MTLDFSKEELLSQIESLKKENEALRHAKIYSETSAAGVAVVTAANRESSFSLEEYRRYGRQMTVPEVGISGQVMLKKSKILVVGAGGLGCPALLYLTGAGVGKIGIVDNDVVDTSNLHRQVLHTSENVGMLKCDSAKKYLNSLNPHVEIVTFPKRLSNDNIFNVFLSDKWDLILDCTDAPLTRYLINDAAVICGLTIVSASGVRADGQLAILNFQNFGPCYRCFYPKPPPPNSVLSCQDGGVIGPAIGVMGVLMASEAIKVICGSYTRENFKPFLNLYSAYPQQSLRTFKMRSKVPNCQVCSIDNDKRIITRSTIESNELNYSEWCGKVSYDVLKMEDRVNVSEFSQKIANDKDKDNTMILDVRPKAHFDICHLPNSINIPYKELSQLKEFSVPSNKTIYCICRFGNDSRLAVKFLKYELGLPNTILDVIGGLNQWSEQVDTQFPKY
ncbi:hypothetical protein PACTADRAFT_51532 [Pachysolen tannophilus NRRL Y-2460]|uniref:Needs CLA4 to survive protein 3 n=1 Tax=Pachysolen tannophilus NRRL Y-2460 TaxID=669874 RepID=A0A1E4TPV2_PACTA|nr:hypothetical protein PACTADRAFT_51532 [Pachysolen tannophilus NRRL Y-2460]